MSGEHDEALVMERHNESIRLSERYQRTRDRADLETAIQANSEALAHLGQDSKEGYKVLKQRGFLLVKRFEVAGAVEDLERAVAAYEASRSRLPDETNAHLRGLNDIANAYGELHEVTGDPSQNECAIRLMEQVVDRVGKHHPLRALYLGNLGMRILVRHDRSGAMPDLAESVRVLEEADAALLPGSPHAYVVWNNLAVVHRQLQPER